MLDIVNVIAPVFALMVSGYLAVRFKAFPREGVRGLIAFVNNFCTPSLLFLAMATSDFGQIFNWSVIGSFYIGAFVSLIGGAIIAHRFFGMRPGESVSSGFTAMFSNTVLVGIPIVSRAYGEGALPTAFSIIVLHAPLLITVGMLAMEVLRRDGAPIGRALWSALLRILQNPLLIGVALGAVVNQTGIELIEPVEAFIGMLAAAVVPAALFGLGGALNDYRLADSWAQALVMSLFQLVSQPVIAWVLMVPVLGVPHDLAKVGVLLAAMPAGINVFVFATYYNRGVDVATNTVLISTALSMITLSAWLWFLG